MPYQEPASPLHATMLELIGEARRRRMSHSRYSLEGCEVLLWVHAPADEHAAAACEGCLERWPCRTVLGVIGGLEAPPQPGRLRLVRG